MNDFKMMAPVAFFIFNRPHTTKQIFELIRSVKPRQLLVIADGPRFDHPEDTDKCAATRAIIDCVDWDCEVIKNYSSINLGMGERQRSGFQWIFETVEEAIMLEDDTVPHPTFFPFCQELLVRYRNDERIMGITGPNLQFRGPCSNYGYYFSRYAHHWGWASWRRAFKYYDPAMTAWPKVRDQGLLRNILGDNKSVGYWSWAFDKAFAGEIDSWDYQWVLACWLQNGLYIVPNVNLVSNVGFGPEATNTKQLNKAANVATGAMNFPLNHPPFIFRDTIADEYMQDLYSSGLV